MKNQAFGVEQGIVLRMLPIKTVGLSTFQKYRTWLFVRRRVQILEPFHVPRPNGGTYILPAGFEFDGGSIPRWLLVIAVLVCIVVPLPELFRNATLVIVLVGLLIERFGLMLYAFAVHDFAVRYALLVTGTGTTETLDNVHEANSVMRRVNFATNDMIALDYLAHLAVMCGAWVAWYRYRHGNAKPDTGWQSLDYGRPVQSSVIQ